MLSSLKVGDLSNMLNFAPLPLRSDTVQILFLVKYATVNLFQIPPIKKSSKSLLIPELEDVKYNTYVLSSKIALFGTFDGIIFVH